MPSRSQCWRANGAGGAPLAPVAPSAPAPLAPLAPSAPLAPRSSTRWLSAGVRMVPRRTFSTRSTFSTSTLSTLGTFSTLSTAIIHSMAPLRSMSRRPVNRQLRSDPERDHLLRGAGRCLGVDLDEVLRRGQGCEREVDLEGFPVGGLHRDVGH